jgi:hypothetical protein
LWIVGGYRRILKASLESGSRTANSPYLRIDWCAKSKSDGWLVGFGKAAILPSETEEDLPGLKCKGKTAWKLAVNAET